MKKEKNIIEKLNDVLSSERVNRFIEKHKNKAFQTFLIKNRFRVIDKHNGLFSCLKCGAVFYKERNPPPLIPSLWYVCQNGCNTPEKIEAMEMSERKRKFDESHAKSKKRNEEYRERRQRERTETENKLQNGV